MLELITGLLVTAGLAPLVRAQILHHGILDIPNHRSSHAQPTPRAGGVACLVGVLIACAVAQGVGHRPSWASIAAASAFAIIGFLDDLRGLPARLRLGAQITLGALVGLTLGGPLLALCALLLLPAVVNAVNFMDGINGISGLTMTLWGATALTVGLTAGSGVLVALGGATAGAALGFLPFNLPRARMFLGDVGSYLFGALVGCGLLLGWVNGAPTIVLAAPLVIYGTDTSTALLRRALRGERLTDAHREHVYQQLTTGAGLSHVQVSGYATVLSAIVTLAWSLMPALAAAGVTLLVCAFYLLSPRLVRSRGGSRVGHRQ